MTLRIYYKSCPGGKAPYLYVAYPEDNALFSSGKFSLLPALSEDSYNQFLTSYNDLISRMWAVNEKDFRFGFLPFSLRNTWQSSYYHGAENYARLSLLDKGDVYFTSPHWFLWVLSHIDCDANSADVARARRDARLSLWKRLISRLRGLHFSLSQFSIPKVVPSGRRTCFFSIWTSAGADKWRGQGADPFYAKLPHDIEDSALVYHLENAVLTSDGGGIFPVGRDTSFMRWSDWVFLLANIVFFRPIMPADLLAPRAAILEDIGRSISNQMVLALISYCAARHFASVNPGIKFMTLYEGNCWEQGVIQAAKDASCSVMAFQHTAFSRGMLKMCADTKGHLPTEITSSGEAAAHVLMQYMKHARESIHGSGSLRHDADKVQVASRGHKVLVLLQGTPADHILVSQIHRSSLPYDVIVRCHPGQPLDVPSGLDVAQGSLEENLEEAALVLYNGTTAAFDALLKGIPCIYICCGDHGRYDPLFMLDNAIKKNCHDMTLLPAIINDIITVSPEESHNGFSQSQSYIGNYFKKLSAHDYCRLTEYLNHD